jgi:hypothetical protein
MALEGAPQSTEQATFLAVAAKSTRSGSSSSFCNTTRRFGNAAHSVWLWAFVLVGHHQERLLLPILIGLLALLTIKLSVPQAGLQTAFVSAALVLAVFAVLLPVSRDQHATRPP